MQLVFSSVERALGDSQSILSKAITAAFKVGVGVPARILTGASPADLAALELEDMDDEDDEFEDERISVREPQHEQEAKGA